MRHPVYFLFIGIFFITMAACSQKSETAESASQNNVVEVIARDFVFEAPAEIPSGWTTFKLKNEGQQEHFLYIYRLPGNLTFEQFEEEAMGAFYRVWDEYTAGDLSPEEAGEKLGAEIPEWFFTEMVPSGGPALTEPGETSQATVKLEPGLHVIECYVKMPDGTWHTRMGMQQPLTVTTDSTGAQPPAADAELSISNYEITTEGELTSGTQTIAVHIQDNPEGFMLHDINLFRLNDTTDVQQIVTWMNWMDLEQFRAPAPGYSLGGVEHMGAGKTGYMTVNLTPGNYAWVSEGYGSQGVVSTFSVE